MPQNEQSAEMPELAGIFGPEDRIPLISDLIPDSILDAVVLGYCRRQPNAISGLLQNDGRVFPVKERERYELFCKYCRQIRNTPGGQKRCEASDRAGVKLLLGKPPSHHEQTMITEASSATGKATCYRCHADNLEVVVPLRLYPLPDRRDELAVPIGAFWGGQCRIHLKTDKLQTVFRELANDTRISSSELRNLYLEDGRTYLRPESIAELEGELAGMADAISDSISAVYERRERLRADELADLLTNRLAELLREASSQDTQRGAQQLSSALQEAQASLVDRFCLAGSAIYRVESDGDKQTITLTALAAHPETSGARIEVSHSPVELPHEKIVAYRGANARSTGTLCDAIVEEVLRLWNDGEKDAGVCLAFFKGARTGDHVWISLERGSPWYIQEVGLQPAFDRYLRDALRRIVGCGDVLDLLKDLEERRAELEKTALQLRHQQSDTQALVVRMAHLVSRPILELQLAIDMLKLRVDDRSIRDSFDACLFELRRASHTFQTYERLIGQQRRKVSMESPESLELEPILRSAIKAIQPLARLERHSIDLDITKELKASPRKIRARRTNLQEIIENLLHNAVKYSFGGQQVEVALGVAHRMIEILVTNYGCQIGEDERERIFELNYRSEMAKEVQVDGSGIGLWVARELAKLDDGTIEVASCDYYDDLEERDGRRRSRYKVVFRLAFSLP